MISSWAYSSKQKKAREESRIKMARVTLSMQANEEIKMNDIITKRSQEDLLLLLAIPQIQSVNKIKMKYYLLSMHMGSQINFKKSGFLN